MSLYHKNISLISVGNQKVLRQLMESASDELLLFDTSFLENREVANEVIPDVHTMKGHYNDGSEKWHYNKGIKNDDRLCCDRQYWISISRTGMNKAPQLSNNPDYY